ncbi:MAG: NADH-quinone oxidoreductase subunit N [Anaerolineae bacterium]
MNLLPYISPELILTVVALLVLGLDLVWRDKGANRLGWLTMLGFILALAVTLWFFIQGSQFAVFCVDVTQCPANIAGLAPAQQPADVLYVADNFTHFFRIFALVAGIIILAGSFTYLRGRTAYRGEFFGLFALAVLAMVLMAGSTNLLMIYLATEFLSYISYILTGFLRENRKSNEASLKYFLYGAVTSATMLYGISLLYGATGSLSLNQIAAAFQANPANDNLALFAAALILTGFGFKIALVPFHQWSPDAYEGAPTPVTAFLSVGPKAAGFAILIRVFVSGIIPYQGSWGILLAVISALTMTVGNVIALSQTNVKRLLAYSSIAQAGYMLIGLVGLNLSGTAPIDGLNAVLIYLFAYLFTNLGTFLIVIAIENQTGATDISQYGGMIRRAPFLSAMLVFFMLSLAGIPPTAGFIGKFAVFTAALQSGQLPLAIIGVINSIISVFYYFRVLRPMFFEPALDAAPVRPDRWLNSGVIISGIMTLVISLYPTPFFNLATASMAMFKMIAFK